MTDIGAQVFIQQEKPHLTDLSLRHRRMIEASEGMTAILKSLGYAVQIKVLKQWQEGFDFGRYVILHDAQIPLVYAAIRLDFRLIPQEFHADISLGIVPLGQIIEAAQADYQSLVCEFYQGQASSLGQDLFGLNDEVLLIRHNDLILNGSKIGEVWEAWRKNDENL